MKYFIEEFNLYIVLLNIFYFIFNRIMELRVQGEKYLKINLFIVELYSK